ncbi:hypothetical protein HDV00_002822 [Rhizophlyctis rosea]|nr:hypothetical protein HDV00_002822 [Rhizophlyctis rosea]
MVGDVNLFFNDHENPNAAEIEIMIAEESVRGQGIGLEALQLMMRYAVANLNTTVFTSKISISNDASVKLFTQKLAFEEIGRSDIFQEVTLERKVDAEFREYLDRNTQWEFWDIDKKWKLEPQVFQPPNINLS